MTLRGPVSQEGAEEGYRRLTPDQPVGLRHTGYVIFLETVVKDDKGSVSEIRVTARKASEVSKPKAFIHWASRPISATVRLYERL